MGITYRLEMSTVWVKIVSMTTARYTYRFSPTDAQAQMLARTFGCVRVAFNWAHRLTLDALEAGHKTPSMGALSAALSALKKTEDFGWLAEVSSVPLQQALRHLKGAWGRCFAKRARRPRFKSKHTAQSAEYTRSAFTMRDGQVWLAKMDAPLDVRWSRDLPSEPTSCTVTLDRAGRYHISFVVEVEPASLPRVDSSVGLDLGLTHFVITSEGEKVGNPRFLQRDLDRLARAQRTLAKKQKGSKNRKKAARRVARLHAKVADRRRDFLHKLSTRLIRENQAIALEDLSVRGMVRTRSLSRSISDVGWGAFRQMLEYKARWYGRELIVIDRFYPSSKLCSECGHLLDALPWSVRTWTCPGCGVTHDRDVNAAKNVKIAAGLAVRACGERTAGHGEQLRLFDAPKSSRRNRNSCG